MEITKLPLKQNHHKRLRVAAYARVSQDSDSLLHSLANQVSYYTERIKNNPDWEFAGVYIDEGITGTTIEKRSDFMRMMDDARLGKIDQIITKSVSRFARNTVDLLTSVRELEELGVDVVFEKDGIRTSSNEGELMLSLLASFAQAESESISSNVKWGKRKQMQEGIYHHYARSYGYEWQKDEYVIVEDEAKVVRFIFESYLDGLSPAHIAQKIDRPTMTGKSFTRGTVKDILKNDIYIGNRTMQKSYSKKIRTKQRNYGELPKYTIPDAHEPIIDKNLFFKVQEIMRRKASETPMKTYNCFSGKVRCGHCGRSCCRRTIHGYKIWKCQGNEMSHSCSARYIREDELLSIFDNEEELLRTMDYIELFDNYLICNYKDGKTKRFSRKPGRKRNAR